MSKHQKIPVEKQITHNPLQKPCAFYIVFLGGTSCVLSVVLQMLANVFQVVAMVLRVVAVVIAILTVHCNLPSLYHTDDKLMFYTCEQLNYKIEIVTLVLTKTYTIKQTWYVVYWCTHGIS